MAQKNLESVKAALNYDVGADWTVSTRLDISSQAAAEKTLDFATGQVGIYSDSDIVFRFDTSSGDNTSANNDLIIPANTLMFLRVPRGLRLNKNSTTIYFHCKQVNSVATSYCRVVEV